MIAYKFVSWDVPTLENLKTSKVYILKEKCLRGEKLTREEKNWITNKVINNIYSKHCIPLQGWMFDFDFVLKRYLVNQYGHWSEYYAFDRTSLRANIYGRIDEIVEIP